MRQRPLHPFAVISVLMTALLCACHPFKGSPDAAALQTSNNGRTATASSLPLSELRDRLRSPLTAAGFMLLDGEVDLFSNADCVATIALYGSCFAQNPAAPYVTIMHSPRAEEYLDDFYGPARNRTKVKPTRIGRDEVLLVFGYAPPTAGYFGFNTYHFSAPDTPATVAARTRLDESRLLKTPNPARFLNFALATNSINNAVISQQLGGTPWDQLFVIATSANRTATERAAEALKESYPELANRIFVESLDPSMALGLGRTNADFVSLFRYAMPQNAALADAWKANIPLGAMRAILPGSGVTDQMYGPFVRESVTAEPETGLRPGLSALAGAVGRRLAGEGNFTATPSVSSMLLGIQGENCLRKNTRCDGDSADTDSYRIMGGGVMAADDVWVVVGVNHTRTNNASYMSLGVMNTDAGVGITSVSESLDSLNLGQGDMDGSATAYGGRLSDRYYVRLFARNCRGLSRCTTVSTADAALDKNIVIIQRAYLKPGSRRGADWRQLVGPVLVSYKRGR